MTDMVVEDGFGGSWVRCTSNCDLQVVRPGKVQCSCDYAGEDAQVIPFPVKVQKDPDETPPDGGSAPGGFAMRGGWQELLPLQECA